MVILFVLPLFVLRALEWHLIDSLVCTLLRGSRFLIGMGKLGHLPATHFDMLSFVVVALHLCLADVTLVRVRNE